MSSTGSVPTISSLQFNATNRKMEKTGSVLSKRIAEVETVLEEESSSSGKLNTYVLNTIILFFYSIYIPGVSQNHITITFYRFDTLVYDINRD